MAAMLARLAGAVSRRASTTAAWPRAPTVLRWRPQHCTLAPALRIPILQLTLKPRSSVLADWNRGARSANRGSPRAGGGGGGSSSSGALFKRLRESRRRDEVARQIDELRPLRDVKEYSKCISALGKARYSRGALALLDEMRAAGLAPNVITYNATISACEKGGQWERALGLLDEMRAAGLAPDVITYNAAIQTCAAGGQPERATDLFLDVLKANLQPTRVTYNALLDATGSVDRPRARKLYLEAVSRKLYADPLAKGYQLDLHEHSEGAAETAVRWWLEDAIPEKLKEADGATPKQLTIVTGWGKTREVYQTSDVRARVMAVLSEMDVPLAETDNPGRVLVDVVAWQRP